MKKPRVFCGFRFIFSVRSKGMTECEVEAILGRPGQYGPTLGWDIRKEWFASNGSILISFEMDWNNTKQPGVAAPSYSGWFESTDGTKVELRKKPEKPRSFFEQAR